MTSAWSGTIRTLKNVIHNGTFREQIIDGFRTSFGTISDAELASWMQSIPALLNSFDDPIFDELQILLELQMPIGAERADVILLGGTPTDPRAFIIELKQWSRGFVHLETLEVTLTGKETFQHPSVQVLNYRGKLNMFHALASNYKLKSAVFLHNFPLKDKSKLIIPALYDTAPLFCKEEQQDLMLSIKDHLLPCTLEVNTHQRFDSAPYEQTAHLSDIFTRHAIDIANRTIIVLAESGIGLSEEQEVLVEEIMGAVRAKKKQVFCVEGGPGSGKTLLAATLLLRMLQQQPLRRSFNAILAMHNSRLRAILKECFRDKENGQYMGADGVLLFFKDRNGRGLADDWSKDTIFDIVICDEAQRMQEDIMATILQRASICVLFLDEKQRLNPSEEGTFRVFEKVSNTIGKQYTQRYLTAAMRCLGGLPYHEWVEQLLSDPGNRNILHLSRQPWKSKYSFGICSSAQQMLQLLKSRHEMENAPQVALIASFTESPGFRKDITHPGNKRIGYPLTSGWNYYHDAKLDIRWVMKDEDYVKFWLQKGRDSEIGSNRLDVVASIYGAQGLESDYVGIFWGRDLLYRKGEWILGDAHVCYDTIDHLVYSSKDFNAGKIWADNALELVKNRYRIFLTRGIKGTLIFCEDLETRNYLLHLRSNVLL